MPAPTKRSKPSDDETSSTMVDVTSDTVTLPSNEMYNAIKNAKLGDMIQCSDQGVIDFQKECAEHFGFEASLICLSGTQANLIATMTHCKPGDEIILGENSHIYKYEAGGASALAGVHPQPLKHDMDGCIDIEELESKIKSDNYHFPISKVVAVENPIFGDAWPLEKLIKIHDIAQKNNMKVHMDGARIHNAAIALGIDVKEFACYVDTMQICFSKSLGAPGGAILLGSREFIEAARRPWKMVGGGMRQLGGIIAATSKIGLDNYKSIIENDHRRAREFREFINKSNIPGIEVQKSEAKTTNMTVLSLTQGVTANKLRDHLAQYNVKVMALVYDSCRIAFHKDISDEHLATLKQAFLTFKNED